jgi:hypothetical protein
MTPIDGVVERRASTVLSDLPMKVAVQQGVLSGVELRVVQFLCQRAEMLQLEGAGHQRDSHGHLRLECFPDNHVIAHLPEGDRANAGPGSGPALEQPLELEPLKRGGDRQRARSQFGGDLAPRHRLPWRQLAAQDPASHALIDFRGQRRIDTPVSHIRNTKFVSRWERTKDTTRSRGRQVFPRSVLRPDSLRSTLRARTEWVRLMRRQVGSHARRNCTPGWAAAWGWTLTICLSFAGSGVQLFGQQGGPAQPAPSPRTVAPVDLTGYWVPLLTEDWRFRVATPPKGDYTSVPLNPAGRKVADGWDPARDEAAAESCRGYGVGGILRLPGRVRIAWQDDRTLKLETEAGTQTRLLSFPPSGASGGDWQGVSVASWDRADSVMGPGRGGPGAFFGPASSRGGSLKVVTTKMKPGYLRKNGVPYSGDAVVTEYFDRLDVPDGDSLLVVSTEVVDPTYLAQPFWTSTHFKKQNDVPDWKPAPCSSR